MTTVTITKKLTVRESADVFAWLWAGPKHYSYKFTRDGLEKIIFVHEEDATAFRLKFGA